MGLYSKDFADPTNIYSNDPLDLIFSTDNVAEFSEICKSICDVEGFSHYAVLECPLSKATEWEDVSVLSNWSNEMVEEYNQLNLLEGSPVFGHLTKSTQPLVFDVDEINRERADGKSESAVALLHRNGINIGVLLSAHLATGSHGGVLFCNDGALPSRAQIVRLQFLANLLFTQACSLVEHGNREGKLSDVELNGLQLVLEGKSGTQIAEKLNLSDFTIQRCLVSAANKLGASTIPEAVGKALRLRLIS